MGAGAASARRNQVGARSIFFPSPLRSARLSRFQARWPCCPLALVSLGARAARAARRLDGDSGPRRARSMPSFHKESTPSATLKPREDRLDSQASPRASPGRLTSTPTVGAFRSSGERWSCARAPDHCR
jgi:hypothetical protein